LEDNGKQGTPNEVIKLIKPDKPEDIVFQVVTGKPQGIVKSITQKLAGRNDLDLHQIKINVSDQQVILNGRFANRNSLLKALNAIHSVEGVDRIKYQVKYQNGRLGSGFFPMSSAGPHGGGEPPDS
jgi:hypothetical protein